MPSLERMNAAARMYGPIVNVALNFASLLTLLVILLTVVVESRRREPVPLADPSGPQAALGAAVKPIPVIVVRGQLKADVSVEDWNVLGSVPVEVDNTPSVTVANTADVEIVNTRPIPVEADGQAPVDVRIMPAAFR